MLLTRSQRQQFIPRRRRGASKLANTATLHGITRRDSGQRNILINTSDNLDSAVHCEQQLWREKRNKSGCLSSEKYLKGEGGEVSSSLASPSVSHHAEALHNLRFSTLEESDSIIYCWVSSSAVQYVCPA